MSASSNLRAPDRADRGDERGSASSAETHETDAPDLEERWPDLTVNDGRRTLGFIYDNDDGTVTATDFLGELLGNFPKRDGARRAIIANAGKSS